MINQKILNEQTMPKPKTSIIPVVIALLVVSCLLGSAGGYMLGYTMGSSQKLVVTVVPTIVAQSVTPAVSTTLGPSLGPTGSQVILQDYIFAECKVALQADQNWTPGKKGENNTCGSLRTFAGETTVNFDQMVGSKVVLLAFAADSVYANFDGDNVNEYLQDIKISPTGLRDDEDLLLIKEEGYLLGEIKGTFAKIVRPAIGTANYFFYTQGGTEYVIIWGGSEAEISMVLNMLGSLKEV